MLGTRLLGHVIGAGILAADGGGVLERTGEEGGPGWRGADEAKDCREKEEVEAERRGARGTQCIPEDAPEQKTVPVRVARTPRGRAPLRKERGFTMAWHSDSVI